MKYGLLGPLRVVDDEREILLLRQKHRALLAFLLLHVGEIVSTDRLLDELWGERPPATAKNSLQNYVSQLRKLLGANVLLTKSPGYTLDVAPRDVDATEFERLLHASRSQAAPERAASLRRAVALWRGPALAGLEFEPFAHAEASRLEELHVEAQEELVGAELQLGRHAELVPRVEELVARNPLREKLRGQLMVALYRSGRQAEALAAYGEARRALVDELGIEPGPALRALEQAILRHDPRLRDEATSESEPRAADLRERRTTVTVLFAEVTAREELDAELHRGLTTRALHELRAAAEYHGGTVERLAGDELLAVFGLPERHEDDALRAVRAALQIRRATHAWTELETRIALETGEVIAPGRALRTPLGGAAVTLAKRIAEAAPPGEVVAGASTLELVGDAVAADPLAAVVPRGRTEPVPVFRITGAHEPARHRGVARTRLVGRSAELATLRAAFDDVASMRRTSVFTVVGEAGVGKTRLAVELVRSLENRARVVAGRCVSYGTGATWLPLREIVQAAKVDLDDGAARTLEEVLGGGAASVADAFWAVRRFLESLARDRAALVVLEDVHWAAPTFLDFVEQLAESPVDAPAFVVCLTRPELVQERPRLASLALEPLSALQTEELVDAAAEESLPDHARGRIAELAEGNPLFAEQLVAYAHEHGVDSLARVPPTVEALLATRLDMLDAEERGVLQRAAVVGREFWQAALLHVTPALEVPGVGRHVAELARKGLIRAARSSSEREDAFRFHHVLIRDVAYASIPKADRAELHEGVAEWLDAQRDANDEVVGYHLEQAHVYRHELAPDDPHTEGLAAAAGRRLSSAGLFAHQRGDSPAAANLLSRATTLLPSADSVAHDLLCELATAQWSAQDAERAAETLERAVAAARIQQNRRAELRARIELANLRLFTHPGDRGDELFKVTQEALPLFERHDDFRSLGRAWLHLGYLVGGVHRQNESWREATEHALAYYKQTPWSVATCVGDLASALLLGPVPARAARSRCRQLLAEARGDRLARAHVQVALAGLEAMLRRFALARRLISDARATYEETGFALAIATRSDRSLGRIELLARRPGVAETIFTSCCDTFERTGDHGALATTASELAEALYRRRKTREAKKWVQVAERVAAPDDLGAQHRWRGVKAKLLAAAGEIGPAARLAHEAVEITAETDSLNEQGDAQLNLAEVLRHAHQPRDTTSAAERARSLFEQKENAAAVAQAEKFLELFALRSRV